VLFLVPGHNIQDVFVDPLSSRSCFYHVLDRRLPFYDRFPIESYS
jgi:hypothetical protein